MTENSAGAEEIIAGRYRVLQTLGAGGMGVVYRALDTVLNKEVAVKTLRGVSFSPEQILRFQTEAVALSNLKHPSIVEVLVFGLTDDNVPYLVMNFVEGIGLDKLIRSRGYIPAYKSVNLFLQLCDGLAHAHKHGVLHRDLKPANVMVCEPDSLHPRPVIVDFGIARVEGSNSQNLTRPGAIIGTPTYMSPEQLRGTVIDARSDVYSVGCIMYETLTGKRLYEGDSELETMSKKLEDEAPQLCDATLDLDFPEALELIVAKALDRDPDKRFQSMEELKSALMSLKSGEAPSDTQKETNRQRKNIPPPTQSKAPPKVSSKIIVLIALLGIAGLMTGGYFFIQWLKPPTVSLKSTLRRMSATGEEYSKYIGSFDSLQYNISSSARGMAVEVDSPLIEAELSERDLVKELRRREVKRVWTLLISHVPVEGSLLFKELKDEPLETLILRGTKVNDEGLKAISKIKTLRCLRIEDSPAFSIETLSLLKGLPNLQQLAFVSCKIDLNRLKVLPLAKLTYFESTRNKDFDGECLRYVVSNAPKLDSIDISATSIGAEDFKQFADMKLLTLLGIKNLNLKDADLDKLPPLPLLATILLARNFDITDKGLLSLLRFKSLHSVGTFETKITSLGIAEFQRKRANAVIHENE